MGQQGKETKRAPVLGAVVSAETGQAGSEKREKDSGKGGRNRILPPPIVTDFAFEEAKAKSGKGKEKAVTAPSSPRAGERKEHSSPHKHRYYKHHEAAPRRLLKRLNSLFSPPNHQHKLSQSMPSSLSPSSASLVRGDSSTSTRPPLTPSPLTAEPESIAPSAQPSSCGISSYPATPISPRPPPPAPLLEHTRPYLKVRICTFNMHDSLPSSEGDLSDFLGDVGAFPTQYMKKAKKRMSSHGSSFGGRSSSRGSVLTVPLNGQEERLLPKFPLNEGHPYHILVVCGQECPTASGVLAGKVRTLDGKGWTSMLENYLCGGSCDGNDSDSDSSSSSSDGSSPPDEEDGAEEGSGEPSASTSATDGESSAIAAPSVDERTPSLATAGDKRSREGPTAPTSVPMGGSASAPLARQITQTSLAPSSSVPMLSSASSTAGSRHALHQKHKRPRGPYVLIEKERLLGIYCAVFVARSCEDLVEGVSKNKVTAGLLNGRIGNKGGVGISLHFASTRLLFISAHLAAHASGLEIRKANALKILEEMEVDDFWEASGKTGIKPKELSARFDQTFFMGDLNFRLNISRLHCDWLCRGKDYATALGFDQLKGVLGEANSVFKGFSEGDISFAPTYKYDVPHKVKKKRSTILGRRPTRRRSRDSKPKSSPIIDFSILDVDAELSGSMTDPEVSHSTAREDDTLSIISSVGSVSTAAMSVSGFDPAVERAIEKADLSSLGLPTPPAKGNENAMDAVRKAQVRFLTLVKSNSAAVAIAHAQEQARRKEARERGSQTVPSTPRMASLFPPRPILLFSQSAVVLPSANAHDIAARATRADSGDTEVEVDTEQSVEPIFDSSRKQRVQSYTDRILFKSTIVPPPPSESSSDGEDQEDDKRHEGFDPRTRRSTNFAAALRNLAHHSTSSSSEDEDDNQSRPSSADGPHRRLRFGEAFNRNRFHKSMSSDSLVARGEADAKPRSSSQSRRPLPRTKSLQPVQLDRRQSTADSTRTTGSAETHPAPSFWKRVKSLKDLAAFHSPTTGSPPASAASPLQSPDLISTAAMTPTAPTFHTGSVSVPASPSLGYPTPPRRTPRKKFTLSSPPSSPEDFRSTSPALPPVLTRPPMSRPHSDNAFPSSPDGISFPVEEPDQRPSTTRASSSHITFPRSATSSAAGGETTGSAFSLHRNPRNSTTNPTSTSSASLNTRFKSFLNLLPLPFLSTSARSLAAEASARMAARDEAKKKKVPKVGPRKGEIEVVAYNSVNDLVKMKATSDHRPVYAVLAVGLGDGERERE